MIDNTPLATRVAEYLYDATATFTVYDVYKALDIYTICTHSKCETLAKHPEYQNRKKCPNCDICISRDKKNILMQLGNNVKKGNLERSRRAEGCYRKIDRTLIKLDIINAEPGLSVDMRFPFGIEKVVRVVPKTLIALAGDSGAGKSAFCLTTALINLDRHPIHYFANNQMTANRIKERLLDYENIGMVNMDNFHAYEREDNFGDVVIPDGINIIDYITAPNERPSAIEGDLNNIVSRLTTGVCFAAIQKKRSTKDKKGNEIENDLGVGGEWTLRVPSIYFALHKFPENKLRIVKAKERVYRHIDPEGMEWKYKLVSGINFCQIQYPSAYADLPASESQPAMPETIEITLQDEPF